MDKIIIINHYGITPDMPGATKHYDLACHFASKGQFLIEFWMCSLNHALGTNDKSTHGLSIVTKYFENNVLIVKIKSTKSWAGLIARQLNIAIFDFIASMKILFSRNIRCIILSMPPISFFIVIAAKIRHIKIIADIEDLWPLFIKEMGVNNTLALNIIEVLANFSYNSAYAIEAVSNGMLEYVKTKLKNKDKKLWLAPLGVNLHQTNDNDSAVQTAKLKYKWCDDYVLMYTGAHGRANDIESVLLTIRNFNQKYRSIGNKRISFVFIGNGDHKRYLLALSSEYSLDNVYFEDALPAKEVCKVLKYAHACITNLKKIESFKLVRPNKIFQYMAAKKPIVCGIWGEAADVVHEANAGIYLDFTQTDAADNLYNFLTTSNLDELGNNGYKYVMKNGNRDIIFEDFYNRLLEIVK